MVELSSVDVGETLGLDGVVSFLLGLMLSTELTPAQKSEKVKQTLTAVYAAGKGYPVMTVEQAKGELPGIEFTGERVIALDLERVTLEIAPGIALVEITGILTTEQVRALLHFMDNPDLYE